MKRLLALLLCVALLGTLFAACGDSGKTSSAPESSKVESSTADSSGAGEESEAESSETGGDSEPSGEAVNGTNPGTELPIVTEPVTLRIAKERHMLDTTQNYNEKASFKNITEETGLTLEFVELAAGTAAEKVPLMLAGGDMPDVFWALLSDAQILQNTTQLVPLEGMLEDFAPNSLKTYEELGTDWRTIAIAPDDHMYGMLSRYESLYENTGDGIQIINKKWLEKVNKEVPTTLDEYYEVLKAFKEQDPNGNGQADEIPYCFAEDMWCASITNDIGMWGIGNGYGDTNSNFHIRDGKVSGTVNTPEYREYLEFFHKLYAEGLIDAEGFSQNTEVFSNKIKNNQVGTYYSWTALEYLSSEQEKDWVVLPTIAAKEGVQPVANGEIDRSTINKNGWVITTQCDHPEAALRLWDYLARDAESKMTVAMGEKGTLWDEYPEGGYYFVVPENTTPEYTFEHMKYTLGTVNNHPLVTKAETPKNDGEISPAAALRDQMVAAVDKDYVPKSGQLPQSYVSPEAIDERAFIETDLKSYIKQFRSQAIMDGFDDAAWDAYCKRLDDLQYPAWLQWYQDFMDGNL